MSGASEANRPLLDHVSALRWRGRFWRFNGYVVLACLVAGLGFTVVQSISEATIDRPIVDQNGRVLGYDNDIGGLATCSLLCGVILYLILANVMFVVARSLALSGANASAPGRDRACWRGVLIVGCLLPQALPANLLARAWFLPESFDHTPLIIETPSSTSRP